MLTSHRGGGVSKRRECRGEDGKPQELPARVVPLASPSPFPLEYDG